MMSQKSEIRLHNNCGKLIYLHFYLKIPTKKDDNIHKSKALKWKEERTLTRVVSEMNKQ